jgi:hypothetical protein
VGKIRRILPSCQKSGLHFLFNSCGNPVFFCVLWVICGQFPSLLSDFVALCAFLWLGLRSSWFLSRSSIENQIPDLARPYSRRFAFIRGQKSGLHFLSNSCGNHVFFCVFWVICGQFPSLFLGFAALCAFLWLRLRSSSFPSRPSIENQIRVPARPYSRRFVFIRGQNPLHPVHPAILSKSGLNSVFHYFANQVFFCVLWVICGQFPSLLLGFAALCG